MNVDAITRLASEKPDTSIMEKWDNTETLEEGSEDPVQHGHMYFEDEELGLSVGMWQSTPYTLTMSPYLVDEFMYVLDGSVTMELPDGSSETFRAGDSFVIPKGLVCRWTQSEDILKYFVIFDSGDAKPREDVEKFGIMRLNSSESVEQIEIGDTSQFLGAVPGHYKHDYYSDPSGQFLVAKWDSDAFERDAAPINRYEMMVFLEGSVTLSDGKGNDQLFNKGDIAFVPKGAPYKWNSEEYLSKFYCIFLPK